MNELVLTDNRRHLVELLSNGCRQTDAAKIIGISDAAVSKALKVPAVMAALREAVQRRLNADLVPLAFGTLEAVMLDAGYPAAARVQAARVALTAAKWLEPSAKGPEPISKELLSMSAAELREELARLEGELGERATVVAGIRC